MSENNAAYRDILDDVEDYAVLRLDEKGNILHWNKGLEKLKGYTHDEVIGKNFRIFYTSEEIEQDLPENLLRQAAEYGKATYEGWRARKDGTRFWGSVLLTAIVDDNKSLKGFSQITEDISDRRKQTEFDNSNLTALINTTHDLIWSVDTNYNLITANRAFDRLVLLMSGTSIEKGTNIFASGFSGEQKARWKKFYARAFSGEIFTETEYVSAPKELWIEISFYPINEEGTIVGTACYSRNITESVKAGIKIKHNESRLRQAQSIAHIGSWERNFDTGISIWSDEHCRIYGLSADENIQSFRSWLEFVHPDDVAEVQETFNTALASLSSFILDYRIIRKDRSIRHIHSECHFDFNNNGDATGSYGIVHDITDQVLAEEKLRHSERRLNQAQSIAHVGSWELDLAIRKSTWSEEHCKIFGLSAEDNIHSFESWLSFVHPDDRDYARRMAVDGLSSLKSFSFYHRIIRRDGAVRFIFCDNHFDFNEHGQPTFLYGVSHDITEAKDAEEKLIIANRLYSFTSHLNQAIVHITDEQTLFEAACNIAGNVGKFELAWIGTVDNENKIVDLIAQNNACFGDLDFFSNLRYDEHGPTATALHTGKCYIMNDFESMAIPEKFKTYAAAAGFNSGIVLPIKKEGRICCTFNLFSTQPGFFTSEEIALLEEASADISFALDVFEKDTQRRMAEEKVRHSEEHLKQAQEVAHFGSWTLDFKTGVATWSEEACRIYGLSPDDNLHSFNAWLSFIHPDDLEHVMSWVNKGQETLSSIAFYHRIVRPDGTTRHIYSQAHFEFSNTGEPMGLYGVAHDVTDMKEAEWALKQSEANLRLIVNLTPQPIIAMDHVGRFIFVNKSFADLYGVPPEQLVNKTIVETIFPGNNPSYMLKMAAEIINTGITKTIPEFRFTDHNGRERIFHTVYVPFTIANQNEKAVLGIGHEITEQIRAEAERSKMIDDIVQRNKDLEQFSYIVSHNLRAPVANIIGLSDLLQIAVYDKEDEQAMMHDLSSSVKKLDTVIKDLNHILQVKHQISEKREPVVFANLLDDIKYSINNLLVNENVEITSDFSEAEEMTTLKTYMYSIFYNLVSNSIKYRQHGIKPLIEITSKKEKNNVVLTFKDNGLGMDLVHKGDQVFGMYKRFHSHTEGKGMGLYMVKTQVETLGGKITVDSAVNQGTTFTITLETN